MSKDPLKEHVDLIREVFAYIGRFQGSTFVFKIDDRIIDHINFSILIKDISLLYQNGIKIILVPGAKHRINEILNRFNIPFNSVSGVRVSSHESIPFIKMAAFDVCNKIMTLLSANNINAVIGNWVRARAIGVVEGTDYGATGRVDKLNIEAVENLLSEGHIPIFPSVGWSLNGEPYNISTDELASYISCKFKSKKLFFIDSENRISPKDLNLPSDINEIIAEERISKLNIAQAKKIVNLNSQNESIEKLRFGVEACEKGVDRVHIIDGKIEGSILKEIFSHLGIGTMIYSNIYEKIRRMHSTDLNAVLNLMRPLFDKGHLVERSIDDIQNKLDDYYLYEIDGIIHGCAALHSYSDGQKEIAALATDNSLSDLKIGLKLVSYLVEKSKEDGVKSLFVLTTKSSDWFLNLGFTSASIEDLPPEKISSFNKERNSRVYKIDPLKFSLAGSFRD